MINERIFGELLAASAKLGRIEQAHLYRGGLVSIDLKMPNGEMVSVSASLLEKEKPEPCSKTE